MRRSTRRSIAPAPAPAPYEDGVRTSVGSFSSKSSLRSFVKRVEKLTDDQRNAIKRTGFGNLLLFRDLMLNKKLLVELMDKWNCDKLSFELGSRTVPITLMDVALILGLPVVGDSVILKEDEEFSDLEVDFGAVMPKRQITISSINNRLDLLGETCDDDFVRTFLLFTMGTLLFPNEKVDSRFLSFLQNLDHVCHFAWGAAVLEEIVMWLAKRKQTSVPSIGGCLIFLQIWSYEHIDLARPSDPCFTFPRVSRWVNSRSNKPQQWYVDKFRELQDHQVICELEPTPAEKKLSIVRELLRSQTDENQLELDQQFLVVNDTDDETELDTDTREAVATENSSLQDFEASTSGYEPEFHQKRLASMSSGEAHVNCPNANVAILSDATVASSREELETVDVDTHKVAAIEIVSDTSVASSGEKLELVDLDSRSEQVSPVELMPYHGKEEEWRKEKQLLEEENQRLKEKIAGLTVKLKNSETEKEIYRLLVYEFESQRLESMWHDHSSKADETRDVTQIDQ
ncbi:Protein MAIN-LIKE 1 [Linum grandiflorum]